MKNTFALTVIFCLISTFAKAQSKYTTSCQVPQVTIDIPLTTATEEQLDEIELIYNRLRDQVLGKSEPNDLQKKFDLMYSRYDNLEIELTSSGGVSGKILGWDGESIDELQDPYGGWKLEGMLRVFAKYIKFRPTADNIIDVKRKASTLIQLILERNCRGTLPLTNFEQHRELMKSITFLIPYISNEYKSKAKEGVYNLMNNFAALEMLWSFETYEPDWGRLNADAVRTNLIQIVGYAARLDNDDMKVRWMKGVTRLMNRIFDYSDAGSGGIKPDGSGFHHLYSYPGYLDDAYTSSIDVTVALSGTSFDIDRRSYLVFRDAVYYQQMIGNRGGMKALSMSGRFPNGRGVALGHYAGYNKIADLAIAGGKILGLGTADPVLAGFVNRIVGKTNPEFKYTKVTPFEEGFIQLNNTEGGL